MFACQWILDLGTPPSPMLWKGSGSFLMVLRETERR
ncbi:MAG: hypothetical protein ACSW8A_08130 [Lachnospiraceae bacterium]